MAEIVNRHNFLDFVYDFYMKMKSKDVNLVYEGEITHQITKAFTSLTESKMLREEEPNVVQKKVFHVMVECLQNISKHASHNEGAESEKQGKGIFMVSKGESEYLVTTGNSIPTEKIEGLRFMLENINSLDKEYVAKYEPNTASPLERIKNLKELINIGIKPGVRIDPIIPFVNDSEESFERLLSKISEIGIKEVTASSIHIRPSIENILKKELSDIHKELLFSYFKTQNWRKIANGPFEKLVPLPLRKKIYERLKVIADKKGIHVKICQCKNPDLKGDKCFSLKSKNRVSYGQLPLFLC